MKFNSRHFCFMAIFLFGIQVVYGQTPPNFEPQKNIRLDLNLGLGRGNNLNSVQLTRFKSLDKNKTFSVGGGARLNNLNFSRLTMSADGANYSGFQTFTAKGFAVAVNLMLSAEYIFKEKWNFGVNTDILGFSMGGTTLSETYTELPNAKGDRGITPFELGGGMADVNLRRGISNKSGILTSEIFAAYKVNKKLWLRMGYTNLSTQIQLNQTEDSFTNVSHLVFAGIRVRY